MKYHRNSRLFTTVLGIVLMTSATTVESDTTSEECTGIKIVRESEYFMDNETFTLNCSIPYQHNGAVELYWTAPRNDSKVTHEYNGHDVKAGQKLFSAIKISDASKEDAGSYTCICEGYMVYRNKTTKKTHLGEAYIELKTRRNIDRLEVSKELSFVSLSVEVRAYPKPTFTFFRDSQPLQVHNKDRTCSSLGAPKYFKEETFTNDIKLYVCNLTVFDSGNYTIAANNNYIQKNITIDLRKKAAPLVKIIPDDNIIYHVLNQKKALRCEVVGYPLATIEWIYTPDDGEPSKIPGKETSELVYKVVSSLEINPSISGNVTCTATIGSDVNETTKRVLVYEKQEGFGIIDNENRWYPEGHNVSLQCLASIYDYNSLSWRGPDGDEYLDNVKYYDSKLSHVGVLQINHVTLKDTGLYTCVGQKWNDSVVNESIHIEVEATRSPNIMEPQMDREDIVQQFQRVHFSCVADAVPTPDITWYKDEQLLQNKTDEVTILYYRNHTFSNSTVVIQSMQNENEGNYRCDATSGTYKSVKYVYLKVQQVFPHRTAVIGGVLATILVLIALVIYLLWRVKKEKRFRKELAAAGLLNFKEGVAKSLNPELGIDEQAELLPYDEKFEFPVEKLTLGKQLGAGAFGVVYKAEARGIINAEESTPVAVKMVKKTADNMYIKALASELKIMVHLGKHINIVNLLGACTKNVGKRELIVIVEYCKFGNIHNYMQKHREVFINQFTDNKEKNLGKVNRGYSCSSGSSALNSDYFGTHSQATDHTLLNSANTNRSERKDKQNKQEEFAKVSETGYIQPEWRSNYESDYSFDGRNPRPLCSRDLLAWAFQIARGMEYLASRKILHGDLAARNVLLAEDNIVKICDFGLAKSIYKNDEYQKKENSPLPVKWLAIECMMDRIFTTQSDVWAFGIVLWEMFSLAKTPYPNMNPQHLLQWLSDGHRLEKPPYADDRLYEVMKKCWEHKPNSRPSFTQLQELLGSFLEDNVRNHYVDLNSTFMDMNVKNVGEDYLAMVSAPDYNNLVTPSPHHYVNEVNSFFPNTPTLDKEGYLQMTPMRRNDPSIFSPRSPSTKFDFDAAKLEPKIAESRGGSELTPMLTLNNVPARSGSDSDHETGHPSYLKMCPRTSEEADDVFKLNENNERNIQNSAVTNPTYISFELDIEKKPKENNNYTNIPNGLVK